MAGDLVKFETTPKHSSASNPVERAIQAVEEQSRTNRADCQMRFGSSETFGADKRTGHGCCVMWDGKSVDTNRKATERRRTNRPMVSITLMKSYLSWKSFLSGFRSRHIVVCNEENVGTTATQCSSRVFRLVEVTCRTNTSFSRLKTAYFRERFDDWNRLANTLLDFSIR